MNLDDQILAYVAGRVRDCATPSDRDIQMRFALKSTDDALTALNRLRADGRITIEQNGNGRVITCGPPLHTLPFISHFLARDIKAAAAQIPALKVKSKPIATTKSKSKSPLTGRVIGTIDEGFIAEVESYIARTEISKYKFGIESIGDIKFVSGRLHKPMIDRTRQRVRDYMDLNAPTEPSKRPSASGVSDATLLPEIEPDAPVKLPRHGFGLDPEIVMANLIRDWAKIDGVDAVTCAFNLVIGALARLEVNEGQRMKPRISAKVLAAQATSGVPFDKFITDLIKRGFACWNEVDPYE